MIRSDGGGGIWKECYVCERKEGWCAKAVAARPLVLTLLSSLGNTHRDTTTKGPQCVDPDELQMLLDESGR